MEPNTDAANGGGVGKALLWLAVLVLIVGGFVLYGSRGGGKATKEPIKIGFIGSLTGAFANAGQNARAAVELAVEEVNAAGGIGENKRQIEVVYEDGKCSGKDASDAANKLIKVDKVSAILGGACPDETSAITNIAEQAKIAVLSYCSPVPADAQAGAYIFSDYPSDQLQAKFNAEYLFSTLGKKKVAVLFVKSDLGDTAKSAFVDNFKMLGGAVVTEEEYEQAAADLKSNLAKIKSANPEAIYFIGDTETSILGIKQIKELGIKAQIFGGSAWNDAKIWTEVGKAGEGAMFSVLSAPLNDAFKASMKAKVGSDEISSCAPQAYDGLKLLAGVLGKAGTGGEAIKNEMSQTVSTGGVSAPEIKFDANGDLVGASYVVKVVKDGKAEVVK